VLAVSRHLKSRNIPGKAFHVLDDVLSHSNESELRKRNIKAIFLPANVASLIQPMDQGVIESLKRTYRRTFVGVLLEKTENGNGLVQAIKTINIKEVIYMIAEPWDEILPTILSKSWKKAWSKCSKTQM
jgi:hypothetical protein